MNLWLTISRLGEAQVMLPTGLALGAWLAWVGERRSAALWLWLLGLAIAATTASKIAFIGWGIGIASLNFTGISGHAMFAAAVLPLLLRCAAASGASRAPRFAEAMGYFVAALVAVSRVMVGDHSTSEAVAGFVLGGAVSGFLLSRATPQHLSPTLAAALVAVCGLNTGLAPTMPTHDMVTRVALWASGHEQPYTRGMMLHRERRRALESATMPTPQPLRVSRPAGAAEFVQAASLLTTEAP